MRRRGASPFALWEWPGFYSKSKKRGVFHNNKACKVCTCKCTKRACHRHEVAMAEAAFTKTFDDEGLHVRQVRIKADAAAVGERKSIVEHPFGTIKRAMDSGYCLTKGLANVAGEFSLTFLAYNIKRAIGILGARGWLRGSEHPHRRAGQLNLVGAPRVISSAILKDQE